MDWAIHSVDLVPPPDELVLCRCLVDGRQEGNRFIVKPLRKKQVSLSLPPHVSPWAFCKGFRVLEFRGNTLPVKNSKGQTALATVFVLKKKITSQMLHHYLHIYSHLVHDG